MRYISMFSGIEAATVAWHPLGWEPAAFCEIEPFPSAVLAHHYPNVPNLGDVTKADFDAIGPIDLAVFGSPCQSFSVAGKRLGLDDRRGNLALYALGVVKRLRPRWFLFENVPGLLSSGGGRDFGAFLGAVGDIGYQCAWRTLDAQYFGVPQRRRRVFVVGYIGDWRRAAAVLFERHSLSGHPAPRREARKGVAVCPTLRAGGNRTGGDRPPGTDVDTADSLIVHSLRGEGFDASEDGTGRGMPPAPVAFPAEMSGTQCASTENLSPALSVKHTTAIAYSIMPMNSGKDFVVPFDTTQITSAANYSNPKAGDPCHPLAAGAHAPAIAFDMRGQEDGTGRGTPLVPVTGFQASQSGFREVDTHATLDANMGSRRHNGVKIGSAVRRLTPKECARLQGFPDDWLDIIYRGKPAADGNKYKALGNSMCVNVMFWLGQRIAAVDALQDRIAA